ncbi:hypothetical protein [Fuchsiella alkaliacetigena]|uniref:hypothetical protein n=1 Tax=Fuchsiella alkaliacetigena TaxID=957042 RepID=UPI00200A9245|nr:hypothetical protein [Fuchsiella alkaliacetigena]MCK8824738.1 hypothetical protein [Fuchsiella alkaliacetigena]
MNLTLCGYPVKDEKHENVGDKIFFLEHDTILESTIEIETDGGEELTYEEDFELVSEIEKYSNEVDDKVFRYLRIINEDYQEVKLVFNYKTLTPIRLNLNFFGYQIKNEEHRDVGDEVFPLAHDTILESTIKIETESGTELTYEEDFELKSKDPMYSEQIEDDEVFKYVKVTNKDYQSTKLIVDYRTIGDYFDYADLKRVKEDSQLMSNIIANNAADSAESSAKSYADDLLNGYEIQVNGDDGDGIINFKTK